MRPSLGLTFDGQSLMVAPADGRGLAALVGDLYRSTPTSMVAIQGTTYATRATTAASRSYPQLRNTARGVLVDAGGSSDILASMTAAQVLSGMEAYHDAARVAGAVATVACTVPPMTVTTAPQEAQRVALNPLILASSHFTAVADIAGVPQAADPANLTYYSDGMHPTAVLAALFATVLQTAIHATL